MSNLDQHLEEFKKTVIELNGFQNHSQSLVNKLAIYEQLLEENNIVKKRNEFTGDEWSASLNCLIKDYSTGSFSSLGYSELTVNDIKRLELELKNRQYQFLLVVVTRYVRHSSSSCL